MSEPRVADFVFRISEGPFLGSPEKVGAHIANPKFGDTKLDFSPQPVTRIVADLIQTSIFMLVDPAVSDCVTFKWENDDGDREVELSVDLFKEDVPDRDLARVSVFDYRAEFNGGVHLDVLVNRLQFAREVCGAAEKLRSVRQKGNYLELGSYSDTEVNESFPVLSFEILEKLIKHREEERN